MAFCDPTRVLQLLAGRLETVTEVSARYMGERHGSTDQGGVSPIVASVRRLRWERETRQMRDAVSGQDTIDIIRFSAEVEVRVSEDQGDVSVWSGAAFIALVEQALRETVAEDATTTHRVHFENTEATLEVNSKGGVTGGTVMAAGYAERLSGTSIFSPP